MLSDRELLDADISARKEALDVQRSFIVQAPAGSGKTELLIQRYLRLLSVVDEPEEVLAITFTKKAAAEMRERIVQALDAAATGSKPEAAHENVTYEAACAALARDREQRWELVDAPRRMRIQTLDAFCAGVARLLPVTSGLGVGGNVVQDGAARQLYSQAALATLDWLIADSTMADAVEHVLAHLDNNTNQYIGYLGRMLQSRDQWLQITGSGDLQGSDAIRERLERNIADVVEHQLRSVRQKLSQASDSTLSGLLRYASGNLLAAGRDQAGLQALAEQTALPGTEAEALDTWRCLADLLVTKDGGWRKRLTVTQGFPPKDDGQKADMLRLFEAFSENRDLAKLLASLSSLPNPRYSDEQWQVLVALFKVLPLAVTELKRVFSEQGACDHVEVSMAAARALGSAQEPGDLALMLDYRIRHMLVDEMQDTSISQYAMLQTLVAGWTPVDGRSFFCVGDPMQSIYRFRNAEVGQFVRAREQGLDSLPLEPLTLRRNFRSGEHLVHWFNTIFGQVFPAYDDPASGAVTYSESVPVESLRGSGEMTVHPLFNADVDEEVRRSADLLEARLAACPGDDIAVLVRSRTQLPELLSELRKRSIAYQAVEIDRLTDLPEIIDLLALTRALSHLDDRSAWLGLLRSPLVGLTWFDLHALVADAKDACVWDLLSDEKRLAGLSATGQTLLAKFIPEATLFLAVDRNRSLRSRIESAWFRLGGPACLKDAEQLSNAYRFLDVVEKLEHAGTLADSAALQSQLEDERVSSPPSENCCVQIMTMHKAKGLEFQHVLLPFLGRSTSGSQQAVLNWMNVPAAAGGNDLILSPIGPSYELQKEPLHKFIEASGRASESFELDRLLYVACTRARRSLQLIGSIPLNEAGDEMRPPRSGSLLNRLWPAIEAPVTEQFLTHLPEMAGKTEAQDSVLIEPTLRRISQAWRPPESPPLPISVPSVPAAASDVYEVQYEWVGAAARDAGTIVHRWLQRFTETQNAPIESELRALEATTLNWARMMGVTEQNLEPVGERVGTALAGILGDKRGRWILEGGGHAELALTGLWRRQVTAVVIDRVRVDADIHWIIDYKTSTHEGGDLDGFLEQEASRYRQQLERYKTIYSAWSGTRNIRTALYFPMMKTFLEVDTD